MPAGLHRDVALAARTEGVSMNQFICAVLAGAVGWTAIALEEKKALKAGDVKSPEQVEAERLEERRWLLGY